MIALSPTHHKMLARLLEPVWLQRFCRFQVRNAHNDNALPPLGAA